LLEMSGEPNGNGGGLARAVRGEMFIFMARASMLFASMVGLPTAGFMGARLIAAADRQAAQTQLAIQRLDLMDQTIKLGVITRIENAERILGDHELRLRLVERPPRIIQP
jgi:hypothetical protein